MTPEQQRIAVAEACGWAVVPRHSSSVLLTPSGNELWHYDSGGSSYGPCRSWEDALRKGSHFARHIPDYLNNLNAVHEAVSRLSHKDLLVFGDVLNQVVNAFHDDYYCGMVPGGAATSFSEAFTILAQATAAQRVEALLRTLNKWEDDK